MHKNKSHSTTPKHLRIRPTFFNTQSIPPSTLLPPHHRVLTIRLQNPANKSHHHFPLHLSRHHFSTSSSKASDSNENLSASTSTPQNTFSKSFNKFVLSIHPDFFQSFPSEQKQNSLALGLLNNIMTDAKANTLNSKIVKLSFFLKPTNLTELDEVSLPKLKQISYTLNVPSINPDTGGLPTSAFRSNNDDPDQQQHQLNEPKRFQRKKKSASSSTTASISLPKAMPTPEHDQLSIELFNLFKTAGIEIDLSCNDRYETLYGFTSTRLTTSLDLQYTGPDGQPISSHLYDLTKGTGYVQNMHHQHSYNPLAQQFNPSQKNPTNDEYTYSSGAYGFKGKYVDRDDSGFVATYLIDLLNDEARKKRAGNFPQDLSLIEFTTKVRSHARYTAMGHRVTPRTIILESQLRHRGFKLSFQKLQTPVDLDPRNESHSAGLETFVETLRYVPEFAHLTTPGQWKENMRHLANDDEELAQHHSAWKKSTSKQQERRAAERAGATLPSENDDELESDIDDDGISNDGENGQKNSQFDKDYTQHRKSKNPKSKSTSKRKKSKVHHAPRYGTNEKGEPSYFDDNSSHPSIIHSRKIAEENRKKQIARQRLEKADLQRRIREYQEEHGLDPEGGYKIKDEIHNLFQSLQNLHHSQASTSSTIRSLTSSRDPPQAGGDLTEHQEGSQEYPSHYRVPKVLKPEPKFEGKPFDLRDLEPDKEYHPITQAVTSYNAFIRRKPQRKKTAFQTIQEEFARIEFNRLNFRGFINHDYEKHSFIAKPPSLKLPKRTNRPQMSDSRANPKISVSRRQQKEAYFEYQEQLLLMEQTDENGNLLVHDLQTNPLDQNEHQSELNLDQNDQISHSTATSGHIPNQLIQVDSSTEPAPVQPRFDFAPSVNSLRSKRSNEQLSRLKPLSIKSHDENSKEAKQAEESEKHPTLLTVFESVRITVETTIQDIKDIKNDVFPHFPEVMTERERVNHEFYSQLQDEISIEDQSTIDAMSPLHRKGYEADVFNAELLSGHSLRFRHHPIEIEIEPNSTSTPIHPATTAPFSANLTATTTTQTSNSTISSNDAVIKVIQDTTHIKSTSLEPPIQHTGPFQHSLNTTDAASQTTPPDIETDLDLDNDVSQLVYRHGKLHQVNNDGFILRANLQHGRGQVKGQDGDQIVEYDESVPQRPQFSDQFLILAQRDLQRIRDGFDPIYPENPALQYQQSTEKKFSTLEQQRNAVIPRNPFEYNEFGEEYAQNPYYQTYGKQVIGADLAEPIYHNLNQIFGIIQPQGGHEYPELAPGKPFKGYMAESDLPLQFQTLYSLADDTRTKEEKEFDRLQEEKKQKEESKNDVKSHNAYFSNILKRLRENEVDEFGELVWKDPIKSLQRDSTGEILPGQSLPSTTLLDQVLVFCESSESNIDSRGRLVLSLYTKTLIDENDQVIKRFTGGQSTPSQTEFNLQQGVDESTLQSTTTTTSTTATIKATSSSTTATTTATASQTNDTPNSNGSHSIQRELAIWEDWASFLSQPDLLQRAQQRRIQNQFDIEDLDAFLTTFTNIYHAYPEESLDLDLFKRFTTNLKENYWIIAEPINRLTRQFKSNKIITFRVHNHFYPHIEAHRNTITIPPCQSNNTTPRDEYQYYDVKGFTWHTTSNQNYLKTPPPTQYTTPRLGSFVNYENLMSRWDELINEIGPDPHRADPKDNYKQQYKEIEADILYDAYRKCFASGEYTNPFEHNTTLSDKELERRFGPRSPISRYYNLLIEETSVDQTLHPTMRPLQVDKFQQEYQQKLDNIKFQHDKWEFETGKAYRRRRFDFEQQCRFDGISHKLTRAQNGIPPSVHGYPEKKEIYNDVVDYRSEHIWADPDIGVIYAPWDVNISALGDFINNYAYIAVQQNQDYVSFSKEYERKMKEVKANFKLRRLIREPGVNVEAMMDCLDRLNNSRFVYGNVFDGASLKIGFAFEFNDNGIITIPHDWH